MLVAWWGTKALVALSPPALIDLKSVSVSLPVLGFTLGLSVLTGIVFGLVPALEATRFDLHGSLKEGGKSVGGRPAVIACAAVCCDSSGARARVVSRRRSAG